MKNLMCLFVIGVLVLTTSCNADIDVNLVNVSVLNKKDEVAPGEELKVKINATDTDGIESIIISIPSLDVDTLIAGYSEGDKWKFEKHFEVSNTAEIGSQDIFVTVTDKIGQTYEESEGFKIIED